MMAVIVWIGLLISVGLMAGWLADDEDTVLRQKVMAVTSSAEVGGGS